MYPSIHSLDILWKHLASPNLSLYGCFQKIGVGPPNHPILIGFSIIFTIRFFWYHYFWKHPYMICETKSGWWKLFKFTGRFRNSPSFLLVTNLVSLKKKQMDWFWLQIWYCLLAYHKDMIAIFHSNLHELLLKKLPHLFFATDLYTTVLWVCYNIHWI